MTTPIGLLTDHSALAHAAREAGLAADQLPGLFDAIAHRKVEALVRSLVSIFDLGIDLSA